MRRYSKRIVYAATLLIISVVVIMILYVFFLQSRVTKSSGDTKVVTFSKNFINVYLVSTKHGHLLIETGLADFSEDIEGFLSSNNVKPSDLNGIIVTHAHHDHAGTARYFQETYQVDIIAGRADLSAFQTGKNEKLCPTSLLAKLRYQIDQQGQFPPFTPDIMVDDMLDLSEAINFPGKVFSVPGHTEGSLVIVLEDMAFIGDLAMGSLLPENKASMHFYQCNLTAITKAINHLLENIGPRVSLFFPSHLGPFSRESMEKMVPLKQQHNGQFD